MKIFELNKDTHIHKLLRKEKKEKDNYLFYLDFSFCIDDLQHKIIIRSKKYEK